jgi:hypothetical protein
MFAVLYNMYRVNKMNANIIDRSVINVALQTFSCELSINPTLHGPQVEHC